MRYTRKNVADLLRTVSTKPDVSGFSSCPSWGYVIVGSAGGTAWQNINNPNHRICEDGTTPSPEDAGRVNADCSVR
ncbi:hypothetical protein [Archangium primigenium]|jgi:hypothetical protein|uniref:hypothetical protein n=1 Tax=Melittangium TaxID=44 RepID=UPI0019598427|nr:hypothetical protein [Archangium primigenium]MBM7115550.1 hypothetical protein [Archangium primigenium]